MSHHKRRPLVNIASPWACEPGVVRFQEPAEGLSPAQLQLLRDDALGQPYILEHYNRRHLFFSLDCVQSSMYIDRPDDLISPYTRKMMAFLLLNQNPHDIVMIGLGGGSLAKFCYRHLPMSRVTVVELDARVIALREQFCIPEDDERFRIVHADGVQYLRSSQEPVDVVLVDAFDEVGIARSLAESDFYANAERLLREHGVLVMNFCGETARYAPNIRGIRAAFNDRVLLVPVRLDGNLLIFASKTNFEQHLLPEADTTAEYLQRTLALEFRRFLACMRTGMTSRDPLVTEGH